METLVAHPQNEAQEKALRAIMEALQVPFETEPILNNEGPYDPEFVAKIKRSDENFKNGKYEAIKIENLWK
jgi:hypothetical protein